MPLNIAVPPSFPCRLRQHCGLISIFLLLATSATAQTTTTYEEQSKLIRAPRAFASIGTDLFGDRVNLSNGTLQFVQTDVSLPGNNALDVSIGRRFVTGGELVKYGPSIKVFEWGKKEDEKPVKTE